MHNDPTASLTLTVASDYEAALVARAKERSQDAWEEIYARHYVQIYRYIQARVFDQHVAEDLASSVFLGAVKGIGAYHYRGQPLLAWLYRIAHNTVSSHYRTTLKHRVLALSTITELPGRVFGRRTSSREPEGPPEADPAVVAERMDLREALQELPEAQREVLIFKFFLGMDAREIGAIVGKEPSAVYSLQARALNSLRRRLR
jgi:RNA polymerase sigma-70 factor, ECF subfamily